MLLEFRPKLSRTDFPIRGPNYPVKLRLVSSGLDNSGRWRNDVRYNILYYIIIIIRRKRSPREEMSMLQHPCSGPVLPHSHFLSQLFLAVSNYLLPLSLYNSSLLSSHLTQTQATRLLLRVETRTNHRQPAGD